ncbi:unnamed protein product [Fraxinus pennsylvanica]|uniref:RNase H type-1 domain-containing protein n=1 Tax=Fraxinus pennsylvanica TaxID=56036 RepID=A0AAD2DR88_9LAMI|nr:unnamed protein product [Fraxinus pennsylvanica]
MVRLRDLVGENLASRVIAQVANRKKGTDLLIWKPQKHGLFTVKTGWEMVRIRGEHVQWAHWVWHNALPNYVSVFMWKALNRSLGVDERIKAVGINLASKYGSSLGNPGQVGGGGVIRNEKDELVSAFCTYFGEATNNEAELRAIIEGLRICRELEVYHLDIERDSLIVVSWILSQKCPVWYLWDFWEDLVELLQKFNFQIAHRLRESNEVANSLASMGARGLFEKVRCG